MATTMPTRVTPGEDMVNGYGTNAGGDERLLQSRTSSTLRMDDTGLEGTYKKYLHNTYQRVPALDNEGPLAH